MLMIPLEVTKIDSDLFLNSIKVVSNQEVAAFNKNIATRLKSLKQDFPIMSLRQVHVSKNKTRRVLRMYLANDTILEFRLQSESISVYKESGIRLVKIPYQSPTHPSVIKSPDHILQDLTTFLKPLC